MKIDRRFTVAILAIVCLWSIGFFKAQDVAMAISATAIGLAGANAYEKKGKNEITSE